MNIRSKITGAVLLIFLFSTLSHAFSDEDKIATIYKISSAKKDITIACPRAALLIKMGDLFYVPVEGKNVILTVTFPMQTVATCKVTRSHQKYFPSLKKGMPVFRYHPGNTLNSLKKDFERIDEIRMYNGRIIRGAIISRGKIYRVLTIDGIVKIKEIQIKNIRIIK